MIRAVDTLPKTSTIIEDSLLEPFFIAKANNGGGFTVYEKVTKNKKDFLMTIGYYGSFEGCLRSIIKEQLNHGDKQHFTSLQEYFDKFTSINEQIMSLLKK